MPKLCPTCELIAALKSSQAECAKLRKALEEAKEVYHHRKCLCNRV